MSRELTPKQKIFCLEYVKSHNATVAARIADLKHPHVQGPRLLDNVRVQDEIRRLEGNLEIDLRTQFAKEAERAFADLVHIRDMIPDAEKIITYDADGNPVELTAKDSRLLKLRIDINESILDRAGYKPVERKQIDATVTTIEDVLTMI